MASFAVFIGSSDCQCRLARQPPARCTSSQRSWSGMFGRASMTRASRLPSERAACNRAFLRVPSDGRPPSHHPCSAFLSPPRFRETDTRVIDSPYRRISTTHVTTKPITKGGLQ
jgi:hypothetical protein